MAVQRLRRRLNGDDLYLDDELLEDILDSAERVILNRRYPFGEPEGTTLEKRYLDLQIRIAVEMINKMGAEGQVSHSETGTSRGYESASVSPSLLDEIVPIVKVGEP